MFNHESVGETFVARKIIIGLYNIKEYKKTLLEILTKKNWGHAEDYVEAMENILAKKPDDYVIATGKQFSVKEFVNLSLNALNIKSSDGKVKVLILSAMTKMEDV